MPSASNRVLTEHEEIRRWAEDRGGRPSCVKQTGGGDDVGILRIDFPGYSGEGSLEEISWDEWLDKFDERRLALIVQDTTAHGQRSNFNKLVSRGTAERSQRGHRSSSRSARSQNQPSGSTIMQKSRNQNRSEGRSSRRRTTARSGEGAGRRSSRSASTRASSSRGKRAPSSRGRASETVTRSASGSRRSSGGTKTSSRRSNRNGSSRRRGR
jgi:hypothetical protein